MHEQDLSKKDLSVEQILTSIKKIIKTEDETADDDVLVLTKLANSEASIGAQTSSTYGTNLARKNQDIHSQKNDSETKVNIIKDFGKNIDEAIKPLEKSKSAVIEEFFIDLIKPYIKIWLDENLSSITKQVIEKEIAKLLAKSKD